MTGSAVFAFIVTVIIGVLGLFLGALINAEGYVGIIFAIASMGAFIIAAIDRRRGN